MYAGINVLTKLMYFQHILYLLGVNKYYGYGYGYGYGCKHRDAPPGDYFNGILNTDLPVLSLNEPNIRHVTHQPKWRDLRTLIEKVFRFFLLINH